MHVCMGESVCVCERECVSVCVRERERESLCVWDEVEHKEEVK